MARAPGRTASRAAPSTIGLIALAVIVVIVVPRLHQGHPVHAPYEVKAVFQSANSIRAGSPVRIAGVNVGKVAKIEAAGRAARAPS